MLGRALPVFATSLLAACAGRADEFDRDHLSTPLRERTGHGLARDEGPLPPGVALEDGVTEEEAVALALWRNSDFAEALAELGFRRADIAQAGMLSNPVLSLLFPLGPKQLEFAAKLPLEALWLRPARLAAAEADADAAAARLVQAGLDLVRDVRRAFAERDLAARRVAGAELLVVVREQLDGIARARVLAGEAAELEAVEAHAELLRARTQVGQWTAALEVAHERLRALLGWATASTSFEIQATGVLPGAIRGDRASRLREALAARPDVRAAEFAIEAAGERAGLARWEFLAISGILDANNEGSEGFEAGPGVELPIPLFNQGQAGRSRAAAEVERAARHYTAVRDRVALEVREAETRHARGVEAIREAAEERALVEKAAGTAARAEQAGETSLKAVWEARLRVEESGLREAEAGTILRAARAELERAVGRRLE